MDSPSPDSEASLPASYATWRYLTRLEATGLALLPGDGVGGVVSYAQVTPMLVVAEGEAFGLNMGAPVRLRLAGGEVGAGLVRREDWDSLSDWGQLVHALKLGSDTAPVGLWVGALEGYSLLSGHLVRRYSNRANPDYHPAGASLTGTVGPLYVEAFASDVLGARLMGAQAEVDLQHLFTGPPRQRGRYTLGLSAVHDWGRAGGASPPVTLAHLDGTAVVVVRPGFELHVLGGWGGRPGVGGAWGAVVGVGADALSPTLDMKLRLEVRRQQGGFRQGYFGPDYELGRLSAVGTPGLPQAQAPFPNGFSTYAEAVVAWDGVRLGGLLQRHLSLSLGAEVFGWGRVDVDGRLTAQLANRNLEVALNGLALGMGQPGARHLYSGQVRWRFGHKLYVLAEGGTLLFAEADGALRPGAFASLGLGMDNAR
ncbi:hypothetical protein [Archangium violaceum]|uniref:hypothetical protein n=1 Tax=Archangium violaceum TaxID=83451 RepID=UPI001EF0F681|nr:hypothetical protein [Archangium violaceum]